MYLSIILSSKKIQNRLSLWLVWSRAVVIDMNFRAGSTFPVPVSTVPRAMDRTSRCNKVEAVRLYASYRLNLLLIMGQNRRILLKDQNLKKGKSSKFSFFHFLHKTITFSIFPAKPNKIKTGPRIPYITRFICKNKIQRMWL